MAKDYALNVTPANEQRRPKNAMSDEWVKDFLHRALIGHVATRWDDQPFITPTSFWYDEARHAIVFHSNVVGRIRATPCPRFARGRAWRQRTARTSLLRGQRIRRVPPIERGAGIHCAVSERHRLWKDARDRRHRRETSGVVRLDRQILPNPDGGQRVSTHHGSRTQAHQRLCHRDRELEWHLRVTGRMKRNKVRNGHR